MSCAGTPSWSRGRGQGVRSRGRRLLDRIRFVAAFLTVVFGLPLSDATVVGGERAVLGCRAAVAPVAGVTRYVDASRRAVPLICSEDILRQAEDLSKVRRDAIQRDVLLARPTLAGGATIVAYVVEQSRAPVTDVDARRASPAADEKTDYQVRVCVENVEICQTDGCQIVFTADG